jgi:hypothetical protein
MKDVKMLLELLLDMVGHNRYQLKPVRLRLSAKLVSQPAVFFSKKTSQQYFQPAKSA